MCRFVRNTFVAKKSQALNAFSYALGPSSDGDDVVAVVVVNGITCSANRMSATPGVTGIASSSCVQWVPPGTHTIDLVITGSTGVMLKPATYFRGGVVTF